MIADCNVCKNKRKIVKTFTPNKIPSSHSASDDYPDYLYRPDI